jgi:hypothetical protein
MCHPSVGYTCKALGIITSLDASRLATPHSNRWKTSGKLRVRTGKPISIAIDKFLFLGQRYVITMNCDAVGTEHVHGSYILVYSDMIFVGLGQL